MGCIYSTWNKQSNKPNVFEVINIDQNGNEYYPGKIEITSENLFLYQTRSKKEPLSWPINSLRRYEAKSNIFCFEVGPRCTTGEGIFAFRCDQAKQLLKLLQTNIQGNNNNSNIPHNDPGLLSNYLEPKVAENLRQSHSESGESTSSYPHIPISPSQLLLNISNIELTDIKNNTLEKKDADGSANNSSVDLLSPTYVDVLTNENNIADTISSETNIYINENEEKEYLDLIMLPPNNDEDEAMEPPSTKLRYISLEFDDKPSSQVKIPMKVDELSHKYTTIDVQRTWALSQSRKPNIKNDIGCTRRTRHNFNLSEVYR